LLTQRISNGCVLEHALLTLKGKRDILFNINGEILSKLSISQKYSVLSKHIKLKKGCANYKELFTRLNIISEQDYFEVIERQKV